MRVNNFYAEERMEIFQNTINFGELQQHVSFNTSKEPAIILFKNFTDLDFDERMMVLTWRNHKNVRSHMYNQDFIPKEHHESFITSLQQNSNKLYFVVYENNVPLGVVDLIDVTKISAVLGLYTNPFLERKGIGEIIFRSLIQYAYETLHLTTLYLECFEENKIAQALYKKFNFAVTKRTKKYNKPILRMEHHRDYWQAQSK